MSWVVGVDVTISEPAKETHVVWSTCTKGPGQQVQREHSLQSPGWDRVWLLFGIMEMF